MEIDELVAKCKDGDSAAIAALYKQNTPRLKKICHRIVHDKQAAEDIVHDAFIIIITSLGTLKDNSRIAAWMNRIVINLAYEYMKSQNRQTLSLDDINDDTLPNADSTQIDLISLETLTQMINKLPESYRNIFRLSVLEGLSHKEISALLRIKPHTSSSILFVAKSKLKKLIADYKRSILLLFVIAITTWYLFLHKFPQTEKTTQKIAIRRTGNAVSSRHKSEENHMAQSLVRQTRSNKPSFASQLTVNDSAVYSKTDDKTRLLEDSIHDINRPAISSKEDYTPQSPTPYTPTPAKINSEWHLSASYIASGNAANSLPTLPRTYTISHQDATSSTDGLVQTFKRWEDYAAYIEQISTVSQEAKVPFLLEIARHNHGEIQQHKHFDMPLTFEIMADKALTRHWSVAAGIGYTETKANVVSGENGYFTAERQKIRYVGIPLKGIYHIDFGRHWSVYLSGGAKLYIPVSAHGETRYIVDGNTAYKESMRLSAPLQWSITTGVGLQYHMTPSIGIFIEPNLNYYFHNGSGVYTPFNEQHMDITWPFGIRIKY